ncbi:MAG: hypothetical protein CMF72_22655 [Mameliella sp.]|nr:hypothetical protein [Mameliella sp.]
MSFIFEQAQQRLAPRQIAGGEASLSDIWGASRDAMIYVDNSLSRGAAIEEAYARRVRAIAEATGETIENPAVEAFRGMPGRDELETMQAGESRYEASKRRFRERLAQLAQTHPAATEAIGAARPIEDDAIAIAQEAEGRLTDLSASRDGIGKWTALLGGGVAGAMRDPLQVGLLVIGGGPGAGRTVATRLLSAAGREALINAGGEAALQPAVQAWREEAGLPSGFAEAMRNIAFSGALGGAFGAAGQGVAEGARALSRSGRAAEIAGSLKGKLAPRGEDALSGDPALMSRSLEPIREALPAPARGAIDQVEADTLGMAARPPALPADIHDANVSEAVRAVQSGSLPEFTPDPAQTARIADLLSPKETAGKAAKPQTLTDFLIGAGGVSDSKGELAAISADQVKRRGKGSLVREGARPLDDARLIAAEAGFFNDRFGTAEDAMARSTIADFLDLVDEDIRTGAVTVDRVTDLTPDAAAARAAIERDVDELQRAIGPGLADDDIVAALNRSAETGEDVLDAWTTLMERPVDAPASAAKDRIQEASSRLGVEVIDERTAIMKPVPAEAAIEIKNIAAEYLQETAAGMQPRNVALHVDPQWAYVLDAKGKVWRLNSPDHNAFFAALRGSQDFGDEALAAASEIAIFRLSRIGKDLEGGIDFFSTPSSAQIRAFKQMQRELKNADGQFSVSLWNEAELAPAQTDILPGWEDADLDAMAARMNDPASGIDDPARPSQVIADSVDDLDADLLDLPADTAIPFDDGTLTADQLRDTLERGRLYQNLVEACRA